MDKLAAEFKALAVTSFGDTAQGAIGPSALLVPPSTSPTDPARSLRRTQPSPSALTTAERPVARLKSAPTCSASRSRATRLAHYDVKISQVRSKDYKGTSTAGPNRQTSNDVWDALVAANPDGLGPALAQAAFDCRQNAFTFGRLNLDNAASKTYRVSLPTETETRPSREFDVKLSLAQTLDLKVLEAFCQNKRALNLQDLAATAIMALDVLLRHSLFRRPELVVGGGGRKFLDARQATPLGEGAQVLAGLFQSVRPTMSGMVVNLDSAYSPYLVTGKLLQVCNMILGREQQGGGGYGAGGRGGGRGGRAGPGARGGRGGGRGGLGGAPGGGGPAVQTPFSPAELLHLKKMLRRAKVRVTHRYDSSPSVSTEPTSSLTADCAHSVDRRPFAIIGFGQPAGKQTIKIADRSGEGNGDKKKGKDAGGAGKKGKAKPTAAEAALAAARGELMSFEKAKAPEKTTTVYEYFTATYPNFKTNPALQCVELRGGQLVPIECLELLQGTAIPPTRLSGNQAATMINVAAKPPAERLQAIQAIRQHQADLGPQSRAAKWGIEVDRELLQLEGRLLAPPRVQYSPSSKVAAPNVRFGSVLLLAVRCSCHIPDSSC